MFIAGAFISILLLLIINYFEIKEEEERNSLTMKQWDALIKKGIDPFKATMADIRNIKEEVVE